MPRKSGRAALTPIVVALAVVSFGVLALPGWAGWTDRQAATTATPTRTPRPLTVPPQVAAPDLVILPTATATPVAASSTPAPVSLLPAPQPAGVLTPYLSAIVARYGIDPERRFIVVDPSLQKMTVWEKSVPPRELRVSTGDESIGRTAAWYGLVGRFVGTFQANGVFADDAWYLFRDSGDILIHSAPYKYVGGQKQYEDLDALGNYPASRGCVRLHPDDARWLSAWNPQGVPLVILPRSAG